jgi:cell division protein FtsL
MGEENEENKSSLEDENDTSSKVLNVVKKIFYISLIILICTIAFVSIYIYSQINSVKKYQAPKANTSINITVKTNLF